MLPHRQVMRNIHALEYGSVIVERAIKALLFSEEIVVESIAQESGQKLKTIRLAKGVPDAPLNPSASCSVC
jgi:hypothetical protein